MDKALENRLREDIKAAEHWRDGWVLIREKDAKRLLYRLIKENQVEHKPTYRRK